MQILKNLLEQFNTSKFAQNLSIVFFETVLFKVLNFAIILFLIRNLGPVNYGIYSFIFVLMAVSAALLDFGLENTAIRYSASDKNNLKNIFGFYFILKISIMLIFCFLIFLFAKPIFIYLQKEEIIKFIPFFIIGFCGEFLMFYNTAYLQATQQFKKRAFLNLSRYFLCLFYIIILFYSHNFNLNKAIYVFIIPFLISLCFIPKYIDFTQNYLSNKINSGLFKKLKKYLKWSFNICITNNIFNRLDFILLTFFVSYKHLGVYNSATQLASIVSFLPFVLNKVMLPKVSEIKQNQIQPFIKKLYKPLILISLIILCIIPFVKYIIPFLLGQEYVQAIPVLEILLFAYTISLLNVPIEQVFYSIEKPEYLAYGKYIQIFIMLLLGLIFIPKFGIISAAYVLLIVRIVFFIFTLAILKFHSFLFIEEKEHSKCLQ